MLLGVLKGLIYRAHVLCDLKENLTEELDLLKNVFISNGVPGAFGRKNITEVLAKADFEGCAKRRPARGRG